jgi:hypothetical protein
MSDLTLASRLLLADLATLSDGGRAAAHVAEALPTAYDAALREHADRDDPE